MNSTASGGEPALPELPELPELTPQAVEALAAAVPQAAPEIVGGYQIERLLGAGAMGEVFLASDGEMQVALKLISARFASDEAFLARFQREISVLSRLDHAHIAKAVGWGVEGERPWLAMEYIDGPNLADVLTERGKFAESDVLRIAMQVGRGLAYVHSEAGLMHRDVKPGNILIARIGDNPRPDRVFGDGGGVKLIDFGLARSADDEESHLTMTGMVMGTPYYMSPEQIRGEKNVDFRTDIYALGAMLFHLVTGRHPFPGASPAVVMSGHLTMPVPDPAKLVPGLDPQTCQLIMNCLQKRPRDRFGDWRALIATSEKILRAHGELEPSTMRILRRNGGQVVQAVGNPTPSTLSVHRSAASQAPTAQTPSLDATALIASGIEAAGSTPSSPSPVLPPAPAAPAPSATPPPRPPPMVIQARKPVEKPPERPGTQALRQAATEKIRRLRDTGVIQRKAAAPAPRPAPEDENLAMDPLGRVLALMPWILLGLGMLALVVVLVWRPWD